MIASSTRMGQALWIVFGSTHLGVEDRREDIGIGLFLVLFRCCVRTE